MAEIVQIYIDNGNDNYVYLMHCGASGKAAVIDPTDEASVVEELDKRGWSLNFILNTHHHWDHTGANLALKQRYNARIVGPAAERDKIPGIDVAVGEGDMVMVGESMAGVMDVPGHTLGHIAFHFKNINALFCGDSLFSMGCGRMFEGDPDMFWSSLAKYLPLPDETRVFCAHEYTMSNGKFALSVEPNNTALIERMQEVARLRQEGKPTVPSLLGVEKATNPFLRPMSEEIQNSLGLVGAAFPRIFAETRARKDRF